MAKKIDFPSVLACERKINPSDAMMYGTKWNSREKIEALTLNEKTVRGTISNFLDDSTKKDPLKLQKKIEYANIQTVDSCMLKEGQDTLLLRFSVKFLGGLKQVAACNEQEFYKLYAKTLDAYTDKYKFELLGFRYAYNLANARFLWRNRIGAEQIEVEVKDTVTNEIFTFNAKEFSIRNFEKNKDNEQLLKVADKIAKSLSSDDSFLMLEISCYSKLGNGQEVFPSEEFVNEKKEIKSKYLYSVDNIAAMHSQKIGNAIRTIDTFYGEDSDSSPIPIEVYGSVTNLGKVYRSSKNDFYTLFNKMIFEEDYFDETFNHYVIAILIRGGVFGAKQEK